MAKLIYKGFPVYVVDEVESLIGKDNDAIFRTNLGKRGLVTRLFNALGIKPSNVIYQIDVSKPVSCSVASRDPDRLLRRFKKNLENAPRL